MEKRKPERVRKIQKLIFIDEDERDKINERMKEAGVNNFSHYARVMLLGGQINQINLDDVNEARVALNRLGNNLNQIAKKVNENDEVVAGNMEAALHIMSEIRQLMNTTLLDRVKQDNSLLTNTRELNQRQGVSYQEVVSQTLGTKG